MLLRSQRYQNEEWVAKLCERLEHGEVSANEVDEATERLVRYGRETNDDSLLAYALFWRARAALLGLASEEKLETLLYEALKHARVVGDHYIGGCTYMLLALDALLSGQILLAFNYLSQVLDCSQRVEGRGRAVRFEVLAYASLGVTFGYLHDYDRGLDRGLHAMTLIKAVPERIRDRMIIPLATLIVLCAIGAKKVYLADIWAIPIERTMQNRGARGLSPLERYCANEVSFYRAVAGGNVNDEARAADSLANCGLGPSDATQLFFSICTDVRHLINLGLMDQASSLIELARPFVQESKRSFVQSHFLRIQVSYQLARGDEAEASRLCMLLFEQDEKRRELEESQAIEVYDMIDDIHAVRSENQRLSYRARHDELTHLRNRQALREDFPKQYGREVCAVGIDVDHFKSYNDALGHDAGDEVLLGVARAIKMAFSRDRCYRTGGDEFLVLACDSDEHYIRTSLEDLRAVLRKTTLRSEFTAEAPGLAAVTVSVGYAVGTPKGAADLRGLVTLADERMFEAKRGGRNGVVGHWE